MTWDAFIEFVKIFGLPLTMAFVGVWAFYSGRIVTRRSYDEMVAEKDRQITRAQTREGEIWVIAVESLKVGHSALSQAEHEAPGTTRVR